MNSINLKMATAIATVLAMLASLAPEVAHARRGGARSTEARVIKFDLNTSAKYENGQFNEAIQNFIACQSELTCDNITTEKLGPVSGDLKTSLVKSPVPTDNLGYTNKFIYQDLITSDANFNNGVLRYDVTFDGRNEKFAFFLPYTGVEPLDSLSVLDDPTLEKIRGVYYDTIDPLSEVQFGLFGNNPITLGPAASVPEPTNTIGLLAFGALGAMSLLKRNRRFNRHLSNQDTTLSSRSERIPL